MRITISILFFLLFLGCTKAHTQNKIQDKKEVAVLYLEKDSSFTILSFRNDTTSALFRIALEGMETEENRNEAIRRHREKGLPFPMFYFTFIAGEPEEISALNGINYVTASEFRKKQYKVADSLIIIHRLENGHYLKWKALFMPYQ